MTHAGSVFCRWLTAQNSTHGKTGGLQQHRPRGKLSLAYVRSRRQYCAPSEDRQRVNCFCASPRDLCLWPFDPIINEFPEHKAEHFYVKLVILAASVLIYCVEKQTRRRRWKPYSRDYTLYVANKLCLLGFILRLVVYFSRRRKCQY